MQQLILTLLALLGLFIPTADRRLAKFFLRFVPQLSSGRVTCDVAGNDDLGVFPGKQQGRLAASHKTAQQVSLMGALLRFMGEGEQQLKRRRPDSLQRRIRRAQHAAGCRSGAVHHTLIPATLRGFFCCAAWKNKAGRAAMIRQRSLMLNTGS